jgi:hypothetical protein
MYACLPSFFFLPTCAQIIVGATLFGTEPIYQQDLSPNAPKLSSNDHLRLGSTFRSMHAIAALVCHFKILVFSK